MCRSFFAAALFVGLSFMTTPAQSEPFKTQSLLILGVSGEGVVAHPNRAVAPSVGVGGHLAFHVRPLKFLSFGTGVDYYQFFGAGGPWAASANVMGRLYPFGSKGFGEWYLQGGVGLMPNSNEIDPMGRKVHGTAAVGYQISGNGSRVLDLAAVVNSFSPRDAALSAVGLQVGIGWRFGGKNNADYVKAKQMDASSAADTTLLTGETVNAQMKGAEASTSVEAGAVADGGVDAKASLRAAGASTQPQADALEGGAVEAAEVAERVPEPGIYKVKIGDNLWRIARRDKNLGQGKYWSVIYKANQDKIKDPAVIQPFVDLKIPGSVAPVAKPTPLAVEPEAETTPVVE